MDPRTSALFDPAFLSSLMVSATVIFAGAAVSVASLVACCVLEECWICRMLERRHQMAFRRT